MQFLRAALGVEKISFVTANQSWVVADSCAELNLQSLPEVFYFHYIFYFGCNNDGEAYMHFTYNAGAFKNINNIISV